MPATLSRADINAFRNIASGFHAWSALARDGHFYLADQLGLSAYGFGMRRVLLIIRLPEAMKSSDRGWNSQGPRFQAPP